MTLEDKLRQVGLRSNSTFENVINNLGNKYSKWKTYLDEFKEKIELNGAATEKISMEYFEEMGAEGDQADTFNANMPANVKDRIIGRKDVYKGIITEYSKANFNEIINHSSPNMLCKEAVSMKPYKIDHAHHDNVVKVHNKLLEIAEILDSKSEEVMLEYAKSTCEGVFLPDFLRGFKADPASIGRYISNIGRSREAKLMQQFVKDDKLDKKKLTSYINNNLSKSTDDEKNAFYFGSAINLYPVKGN